MNLEVIPADTSPEAWAILVNIYRRMSPNRRLELVCEMSNSLRRLVADGVRNRHPDYTEDQVRLAVIQLWLGEDLFRQGYPGVDIAV
jgi:hypothetical protein